MMKMKQWWQTNWIHPSSSSATPITWRCRTPARQSARSHHYLIIISYTMMIVFFQITGSWSKQVPVCLMPGCPVSSSKCKCLSPSPSPSLILHIFIYLCFHEEEGKALLPSCHSPHGFLIRDTALSLHLFYELAWLSSWVRENFLPYFCFPLSRDTLSSPRLTHKMCRLTEDTFFCPQPRFSCREPPYFISPFNCFEAFFPMTGGWKEGGRMLWNLGSCLLATKILKFFTQILVKNCGLGKDILSVGLFNEF